MCDRCLDEVLQSLTLQVKVLTFREEFLESLTLPEKSAYFQRSKTLTWAQSYCGYKADFQTENHVFHLEL